MAHNQKIKYDDKKVILQITDIDEYNKIGQQDGNKKDNLGHEYVTRKKEAQKANLNSKVKIDKKKLVKKKEVVIPKTKKDKKYLDIIASKKEIFGRVKSRRGFLRIFEHQYLPDPEIYEATYDDIQFLKNMNKNSASSLVLKLSAFEKIIQLWEENCRKEVELEKISAFAHIRHSGDSDLKSKAALNEDNLNKVFEVGYF